MRHALVLLLLASACIDRSVDDNESTTGGGDPTEDITPTTGEPETLCSPAEMPTCSGSAVCCSDDPATAGGRLPNYFNGKYDSIYGPPLFSGNNNDLSYSGQCVEVGGESSPFASGCPVPCNPTWDAADIETICGGAAECCQTRQVDPEKDCVLDPTTGKWRAVVGTDIGAPPKLSTWGGSHTTNQDPAAKSCMKFAGDDKEALVSCYEQLTVADKRGFCATTGCPCLEDLCDQKNPGWTPRCST